MGFMELSKEWVTYMKEISQELGLVIFFGVFIGFFIFVIITSKRKKDKDSDKKDNQ